VHSNPKQHQRQGTSSGRPRTKRPSPILGLAVAAAVGLASFGLLSALFKPPPARPGHSPKEVTATHSATLTSASPAPVAGTLTNDARTAADPPLADAERSAQYVNGGTALFQEGKFGEAAALYAEAVKLAPDDETAQFNLGLALVRLGKLEEAKPHYLEALRIFPDYAEAHNNLGNLLASQGQLSEAVTHFNEALKATPDSASAHNNLGTALVRQGKTGEALEHFSEAVRLMPDYVQAHCNLGNTYLVQGQTNEAVAAFTAALRLQPDFVPASLGLARAQHKAPPPVAPPPATIPKPINVSP